MVARVTPSVPVSGLTQNLVRFLVVTLGLLAILNGLNVDVRPALAALGVGGLAVALALQEPLSNLFAGLFVTLAGQIRIGDYVKLESGQKGSFGTSTGARRGCRRWRATTSIVPNSKLAQAIVINFSLPTRDTQVVVDIGVDYGSDLADGRADRGDRRERGDSDVAGSRPGQSAGRPVSHVFRCRA